MLLFCDSFDHYTALNTKYNLVSTGGASPTISASAARNGIGGLKANSTSGGVNFVGYVIPNRATVIVGFAFLPGTTGNTNTVGMISFCDGNVSFQGIQVDFRLNSSLKIVCTTRNGTVLATSATALQTGVWAYLEFKVTVDPSAGVVQLRINGVLDANINLTSQNTRETSNSQVNMICIGQPIVGANAQLNWSFDDFYILDTTGSFNNTFLGDTTVQAITPAANGTQNNWTPSGSGPNWSFVDENPPNGDGDYVKDGNVGDIDRYLFPNPVPSEGSPLNAVMVWLYARKEQAGPRSVRVAVNSGGTVTDNGTDLPLGQGYQYLNGLFETDPNTGAAWTLTNALLAEYGIKLTV